MAYRRFKHVPIYLEWAPLAARTTARAEGEASDDRVATGAKLKKGFEKEPSTDTLKSHEQIADEDVDNAGEEDGDGDVSTTVAVEDEGVRARIRIAEVAAGAETGPRVQAKTRQAEAAATEGMDAARAVGDTEEAIVRRKKVTAAVEIAGSGHTLNRLMITHHPHPILRPLQKARRPTRKKLACQHFRRTRERYLSLSW